MQANIELEICALSGGNFCIYRFAGNTACFYSGCGLYIEICILCCVCVRGVGITSSVYVIYNKYLDNYPYFNRTDGKNSRY